MRFSAAVRYAALAAVIAFVLVLAFASVLRHPRYTPDGIVYARFAARDAGYSERDATLAARDFYDGTGLMTDSRYRALIELDPSVAFQRSHVFVNRPLYPWIAGLFLHAAGFRALFYVSAAAYVAFGVALFWMLGAFRRPLLSGLVAIAVLSLPSVRASAESDLTDMLSMLWWAIALGALLRAYRTQSAAVLATLAISSVLLVLTRPTPYLVVVPALALSILIGSWRVFAASVAAIAAYGCVAVVTHAYGLSEQLHWIYEHERSRSRLPFDQWYRHSLSSAVRYAVVRTFTAIAPAAGILLAIAALIWERTRGYAVVLSAAALAALVAIPFNPVGASFPRVIGLPLWPVAAALFVCVVDAVLELQRGGFRDVGLHDRTVAPAGAGERDLV